MKLWIRMAAVVISVMAAGCQGNRTGERAGTAAAVASIPAGEWRAALADLARAHEQKMMLALWVSTFRPVDEPFKPFYAAMGKVQGELLSELQSWASDHDVSLAFRYTDDVPGRALKIMEDRQEKLIREDNRVDFQRDNLMQMYSDYEYQVSEIQALLPSVTDAALRAYLEKSLKVHEAGSAEIMGLLKQYRFGGQ